VKSERPQERRAAQEIRSCNQDFDSVTTSDIKAIFSFLLERVGDIDDGLEAFQQFADLKVQYNITAAKVCLKCSDVGFQDFPTEALLNSDPKGGFQSYCNFDEYGWDATHSAIVLYPVEDGGKILSGELRGIVIGHDTAIDVSDGPTDFWPSDGFRSVLLSTTTQVSAKVLQMQPYLSALGSATAGAVVIMPDYIGYGESKAFDRAFLQPLTYLQATTVTYAATKRYISQVSFKCTELVNTVTITGYGEGGYFAVIAALAFQKIGFDVLSVRPGGTPFDLDTQLLHAFAKTGNGEGLAPALQLFLAFFGYAYSNDFSFMANTNTGQKVLSQAWMDESDPSKNVVEWFDAPDNLSPGQILSMIPSDPKSMFEGNLSKLYGEAVFEGLITACRDDILVTDLTSSICDAIIDASLWEVLMDMTIPVSLCHSPQDEVVAFENLPDPTMMPSNMKFYSNEIDALNPRGHHEKGMLYCAMDTILLIATTEDGSNNSPVYRQPLKEVPGQCRADDSEESAGTNCSAYYEQCHQSGGKICCLGFTCQDRVVNGAEVSVCSPNGKNSAKNTIADEGAGGADRGG
jgi:hypothetical protein